MWCVVAYELVQEVLDHAPTSLGPAERLILACIAEECRRGTRSHPIDSDRLQRRTGLDSRGLRHAYARLAKAGLQVRRQLGVDKRGNPIYAVPGTVCTFVLPPLPPPPGCPCHRCGKADPQSLLPEKEDVEVRQADVEVRQATKIWSPDGPTGPPIQSGDPYGVSPDHAEGGDLASLAIPDNIVLDRHLAIEVIRAKTARGRTRQHGGRQPP